MSDELALAFARHVAGRYRANRSVLLWDSLKADFSLIVDMAAMETGAGMKDADIVAAYKKLAEARAKAYLDTRKQGRPKKVTTERIRDILRVHGKVTKGKMVQLLYAESDDVRDESVLTKWAAKTEWGTWTRASAALLAEIKTGKY